MLAGTPYRNLLENVLIFAFTVWKFEQFLISSGARFQTLEALCAKPMMELGMFLGGFLTFLWDAARVFPSTGTIMSPRGEQPFIIFHASPRTAWTLIWLRLGSPVDSCKVLMDTLSESLVPVMSRIILLMQTWIDLNWPPMGSDSSSLGCPKTGNPYLIFENIRPWAIWVRYSSGTHCLSLLRRAVLWLVVTTVENVW